MNNCLITGSLGLVGGEAVKFLIDKFDTIVGIDNNQRSKFFGTDKVPVPSYPNYIHSYLDIRDELVEALFQKYKFNFIIAAGAQPSHDLAASIPLEDFEINATGTLRLLEYTRKYCPESVFIQVSTNKVYGALDGQKLSELSTRYEGAEINESQSIDQSLHSLFGVSKASGDLAAQEYGRYFGLKTGIFRCGCITGGAHKGAKLHGFLSYLIKCCKHGQPYQIIGYKGKQVRDQIHAYDLVTAFWEFYNNPKPGEVYNLGGGRHSNCSVIEAVERIEQLSGKKMIVSYEAIPRRGDHQFYISDLSKFKSHFPDWKFRYSLDDMFKEIYEKV